MEKIRIRDGKIRIRDKHPRSATLVVMIPKNVFLRVKHFDCRKKAFVIYLPGTGITLIFRH
jgi:hypothetical protein